MKDGRDGMVLVKDGSGEWQLKKADLITLEDVPTWAERRLKANSKDLFALATRATSWCDQERYAEAEKDYSDVVKCDPDNLSALARRAWVRCKLNAFDDALLDFDAVIKLEPSCVYALSTRGQLLLSKREWKNAESDFIAALKLEPLNRSACLGRAAVWFNKGELGKCLEAAEDVVRANAKDADGWQWKAKASQQLGKQSEAKEAFRTAAKLESRADRYVEYARFLSTCPDEKCRDASEAILLMKLTQQTQDELKLGMPAEYVEVFAAAYAEAGEFDEAVEKQSEAVKKLKADKRMPVAEVKRAEAALELFKKNKPLRE